MVVLDCGPEAGGIVRDVVLLPVRLRDREEEPRPWLGAVRLLERLDGAVEVALRVRLGADVEEGLGALLVGALRGRVVGARGAGRRQGWQRQGEREPRDGRPAPHGRTASPW